MRVQVSRAVLDNLDCVWTEFPYYATDHSRNCHQPYPKEYLKPRPEKSECLGRAALRCLQRKDSACFFAEHRLDAFDLCKGEREEGPHFDESVECHEERECREGERAEAQYAVACPLTNNGEQAGSGSLLRRPVPGGSAGV